MAFDCDITWESELEATIQVHTGLPPRVPVTLKNVRSRGSVRVILAMLTKASPCGFGAKLVSFQSMPEIGLDVSVAGGEVTKVLPALRTEIIAGIQRRIADSMIWPKRVVFPSVDLNNEIVLSLQQLKVLESADPLLHAEEASGSRPGLRSQLHHTSDLFHQIVASDKKSFMKVPTPSFVLDQRASRRPTKCKYRWPGSGHGKSTERGLWGAPAGGTGKPVGKTGLGIGQNTARPWALA
jgi:hypothetical protein